MKTTRSHSDDVSSGVDLLNPSTSFCNNPVGYNSDSDGPASTEDYLCSTLVSSRNESTYVNPTEKTRRGILKQGSLQEPPSPGNSPVQTEFFEMVDQDNIIALTLHVRSFSDALNLLRNTFAPDESESSFSYLPEYTVLFT